MATINNFNSNTILSGSSGNDFINNYSGSNVYISGGAGSDVIGTGTNYYDSSSGKNVTVNGGTGDDFITGMSSKGVLYEYSYGDGNDFINGFNSNDTLQIYNSNYSTMISGDDLIVFVGAGSITLKNSANISVKIRDAYGYMTTYNLNPLNILQGSDYADVITNTNKNSTCLDTRAMTLFGIMAIMFCFMAATVTTTFTTRVKTSAFPEATVLIPLKARATTA